MAYRQTLPHEFMEPYVKHFGGYQGLRLVPYESQARFVTHPGKRHVIFTDYFQVMLKNVKGGYVVHDRNGCFRYSVATSLETQHAPLYANAGVNAVVPLLRFGLDPQDILLVQSLKPGDYVYLTYETLQPGGAYRRQVDILMLSPASVLVAMRR